MADMDVTEVQGSGVGRMTWGTGVWSGLMPLSPGKTYWFIAFTTQQVLTLHFSTRAPQLRCVLCCAGCWLYFNRCCAACVLAVSCV